MKYTALLLLTCLIASCHKNDDDGNNETIYKQHMRDFVIGISQYARASNPAFAIIPQNGIELVSDNGDVSGQPHAAYLAAIDGNGQEDLYYGYDKDDQASPADQTQYLKDLLNISKTAGKKILVTDYCSTSANMTSSYQLNAGAGYTSFAASQRELNNIPAFPSTVNQESNATITNISQARNFLYLINPTNYATKASFIAAVTATNYDLLIMDLYFNDGTAFTAAEVAQLRAKANGGKRLVISYMSIGEAEDYRYYWQPSWTTTKPAWLDAQNPDWPGNYKVKYWDKDWQNIIYGNDSSYLKKVLNAGFDGAYLDIIDAFEYYEQ